MTNMHEEDASFVEWHETIIRVRYSETDKMGVVYHANYLVWFEIGRTEFCRARGFAYKDMEENDHAFLVVAESYCRYKAPTLRALRLRDRQRRRRPHHRRGRDRPRRHRRQQPRHLAPRELPPRPQLPAAGLLGRRRVDSRQ